MFFFQLFGSFSYVPFDFPLFKNDNILTFGAQFTPVTDEKYNSEIPKSLILSIFKYI